ncbi:MAG: MOSC domain-containing protein YiiM [Aureispira sp.]|jgi:MOSC domain-containing protein YiiM
MVITNLLVKRKGGDEHPLEEVKSFEVDENGIIGAIPASITRHVLFLPKQVLEDFNLAPGNFRENIIIDGANIHALKSGTVLLIGTVKIRLTYHCEPCKRVRKFGSIKDIMHKRGYLGTVLNAGTINVNDTIEISQTEFFDVIPYEIKERIQWYLNQQENPVSASQITVDLGFTKSTEQVIPKMVEQMGPHYQKLLLI